jgi:hypothetical protein
MRRLLAVVFSLALLTSGFAQAESVVIAEFGAVPTGQLNIKVEREEDGSNRGQLWTARRSLIGVLIFRKEQWAELVKTSGLAMGATGALLEGQSKTFGELNTSGASTLRVDAVEHHDHTFLRLTRLDGPGGTYPPITVEISSNDFTKYQKALDTVTVELNSGRGRPERR